MRIDVTYKDNDGTTTLIENTDTWERTVNTLYYTGRTDINVHAYESSPVGVIFELPLYELSDGKLHHVTTIHSGCISTIMDNLHNTQFYFSMSELVRVES